MPDRTYLVWAAIAFSATVWIIGLTLLPRCLEQAADCHAGYRCAGACAPVPGMIAEAVGSEP